MKIKDKKISILVDVIDQRCFAKTCYWPRPDPGSFSQGRGYHYDPKYDRGYICGTREIHGCPQTTGTQGWK